MESSERGSALALLPPGSWSVDRARSTVRFAIKPLLGRTVRGRFSGFEGGLEKGACGMRSSGVVATASVETGMVERDAHLRGPEYLDADQHPEIRFESDRVDPGGPEAFWVCGDLTIAGVTRPVRLRVSVQPGSAPERAMLQVRGTVHRTDFGIVSKSLLEAGVSDRVDLALDLSAVRIGAPSALGRRLTEAERCAKLGAPEWA